MDTKMNALERREAIMYVEPEIKNLTPELYELSRGVLSLRGENSGEYIQCFSSEEVEEMRENMSPTTLEAFYGLLGEKNSFSVISVGDADEANILAELFPFRRRIVIKFENYTGQEMTKIKIKSKGVPKIEKKRKAPNGNTVKIEERNLLPEEGVALEAILSNIVKKNKDAIR